MCVIIDTDLAAHVFAISCPDDFKPLWRWILDGDGCIVYGGRLAGELNNIRRVREGTNRSLKQLSAAGKARLQDRTAVSMEERRVVAMKDSRGRRACKSNDCHVIALARLSGARVLCSADQTLHADFKNLMLVPSPKGKIYQKAGHAGVLGHTPACVGRPRR